MNYPKAYIEYLVQFHATRDFFECHELLEEYWKEHTEDAGCELWVGMIQLAVAQYHERRGQRRGAQMMYVAALDKLARYDSSQLGLIHDQLVTLLEDRIAACITYDEYADLSLPFADEQLLVVCREQAEARGLIWERASSEVDEDIIYRHSRRDRSDVIAARAAALLLKQQEAREKALQKANHKALLAEDEKTAE
jgi:predicted metal-dependent hydrolase